LLSPGSDSVRQEFFYQVSSLKETSKQNGNKLEKHETSEKWLWDQILERQNDCFSINQNIFKHFATGQNIEKKKNTKRFVALKLINPWSDDGKSLKRKFCFFEDFWSLEKVLIKDSYTNPSETKWIE
jgi:hypothetical protein